MNWTKALAEESRKNCLLRLDDLARQYHVQEVVVQSALRRYEVQGIVEHVSNKVYINRLNQQFSPRDLVNVLRPKAYVSLESVLVEDGVISQNPAVLTCVTTENPKTFRGRSVTIVYRKISRGLYWGFQERRTRYNNYQIAEPEKAFLDWIYLNRQEGLPTPLDEVNLRSLDHKKLIHYSTRFPSTVEKVVKQLMFDTLIAE